MGAAVPPLTEGERIPFPLRPPPSWRWKSSRRRTSAGGRRSALLARRCAAVLRSRRRAAGAFAPPRGDDDDVSRPRLRGGREREGRLALQRGLPFSAAAPPGRSSRSSSRRSCAGAAGPRVGPPHRLRLPAAAEAPRASAPPSARVGRRRLRPLAAAFAEADAPRSRAALAGAYAGRRPAFLE